MAKQEVTPFYRVQLHEELSKRTLRNPRYSIRAFAQALEIDVGTVSKVLAGKQIPSTAIATRLLKKMALDPIRRDAFLNSIADEQSRRQMIRVHPFDKGLTNEPATPIDIDKFDLISDWYHVALLELTFVKDFNPNPKWISKRLNISEIEARLAVEKLLRLGLLSRAGNKLQKTEKEFSTLNANLTTAALKKHQSTLLTKAITALEEQPLEKRSMTAMTMAIDPSQLPAAKKLIREFNRKMSALLETGNRTDVYTLEIALFALDENFKNKDRK